MARGPLARLYRNENDYDFPKSWKIFGAISAVLVVEGQWFVVLALCAHVANVGQALDHDRTFACQGLQSLGSNEPWR